jgi:hypothetical protein
MRQFTPVALVLALCAAAPVAAQNKNLKFAKKCTASIEVEPGKVVSTTYHALYWSPKSFEAIESKEALRQFYNGFIRQMLRMELVLPCDMSVFNGEKAAPVRLKEGAYQATFVHKGESGWHFVVNKKDQKDEVALVKLNVDRTSKSEEPLVVSLIATETEAEPATRLKLTYGPLSATLRLHAVAPESRPADR